MRKTFALLLAAGLSASGSIHAAPVTSDGIPRMADIALETLARRQQRDRLIQDFAARGDYGALVSLGERLLAAQPQDNELRQLVAAAHAAVGQRAEAEHLLEGSAPGPDQAWGLIARALLARQAGDLPAAEAAARRAIAADPGNAYARNVAGTVAVLRGDLPRAAAHFAAAVERGPEGAPFLANLGATLAELGDAAGAGQALDRALQLAPDDCGALITAAGLRTAQAGTLLTRCLTADPGHPLAAARLVETHLAQGDVETARATLARHADTIADPALVQARIALHAGEAAELDAALARVPPSSQRALLQALAAALRGDLDGALDQAAAAQEADLSGLVRLGLTVAAGQRPDPDQHRDHPQARLFAALGDLGARPDTQVLADLVATGEALPWLRFEGLSATDLAPLHDAAVRRPLVLALMFESAGLSQPSRTAYEQATAAAPEGALMTFLQARNLIALDRSAALAALDRALAAAPGFAAAHRLKADLLARTGQNGPALEHLAAALAVHEDATGRLMQGVLAETAGRDDLAREAYERSVVLAPQSFAGLNQLAWFLASRNTDLDRALALAQQADGLQPGNASILDTKGWIQFLTGRTQEALATLRAAHQADGGRRPEIALHLARAEAAAGNLPRATALLQAIAGSGPDPIRAEAAALLAEIGRG